jgi:hypothetical protein
VLGEQAQGGSILVWCGEVVVVPSLNRRPEAVREGEIFSRRDRRRARVPSQTPAGFAATNDGTARRVNLWQGSASRGGAAGVPWWWWQTGGAERRMAGGGALVWWLGSAD